MSKPLFCLLFAVCLSGLLPLMAAADNYELVFADEFDQPDGSPPDPAFWTASRRGGSVWNRWISTSPDVAFIHNGHLVCRAIPNPDTQSDNVPMLTGAVETRDKFSFTYGRVEVRLRTNVHEGNFPAAWMMPQPPCDAWPRAGEIDIFESIDAEHRAYHTLHTHWTYDLGHKTDPVSSFTTAVNVRQWHVYAVEWTEDKITWSVDGREVGAYDRSDDSAVLAQGQWPFDHPFYLILNQSVGNGSWAREADTAFTYETVFDWVRVYQRIPDAISDLAATPPDRDSEASPRQRQNISSQVFDLCGRPVLNRQHSLSSGFYVIDGRKYVVR